MDRSATMPYPLAARVSAFILPAVAGATLGVALACLWAPIRWDDQAFYMYAAPHLLDGYRLYSPDFQDTNPPLIAWLAMLAAAIGRPVGATSETSFVAFVALLSCGAIAWSLRLAVDRARPPIFAAWLAVVLVYITVVLPSVSWKLQEATTAFGMALRYDFGQREHILALLTLPYLFLAARRLERRTVGTWEAILIGIVAALGLSLKPQYLTVAAAVEGLLLFQRRTPRDLLRPELVALVAAGLIYCATVWIATPDYFTTVIPTVAAVYGDFSHKTAAAIMMTSKYNFAVVAAGLIAFALMRRSGAKGLASVFLVAGTAAFVSFLLQGKGWSDHLLPAEMFLAVALGTLVVDRVVRRKSSRDFPGASRAMVGVTTVVACVAAFALYSPARAALWAKSEYARQIRETNEATAGVPSGAGFVILADAIYSQFDIAMDRGFVWASRYPFLLLPQTAIQSEPQPAREQAAENSHGYFLVSDVLRSSGTGTATPNGYARMLRTHVVEDFQRWNPAIVLVQRCNDPITEPCTFGAGFKLIDWLSADPAFASIMSNYTFARRVERFDLYLRRDGSAPAR